MTDRPSSTDSGIPTDSGPGAAAGAGVSAAHGSSPPPPQTPPPGLRDQFGRTRVAAIGLLKAHLDLAKAEFSEIIGEIKKAVMLGSAALGLVFVAATILTVGSVLWLDEWWFGSIGWGVLHGTELFLAIAVLLVLAIVDLSFGRALGALFIAFVVGAIVFAIFALQLTSRGLGWIGDQAFTGLSVSAADRPIWVGVIIFAVIFGAIGLLIGLVGGSGVGRILGAIFLGIIVGIVGALFGAFLGVPMSWVCALAVGIAVLLVIWPVFAALMAFRGLDTAKLKDRFVPDQTIDTTKETIEWVRAQTPLGRKS